MKSFDYGHGRESPAVIDYGHGSDKDHVGLPSKFCICSSDGKIIFTGRNLQNGKGTVRRRLPRRVDLVQNRSRPTGGRGPQEEYRGPGPDHLIRDRRIKQIPLHRTFAVTGLGVGIALIG